MTTVNTPSDIAAEQHALWNGPAGHAWTDAQDMLDRMFGPFEAGLIDAARTTGARRVLDVGCGTGATTLAVARVLGHAGRCVGIDISEPMLALARQRAARAGLPVEFVNADAEQRLFEPASFDLLVSRFGVMFFADPVRAFGNLRRAVTAGGALHCIAWRSAADNPFMTTAERAAAPLLEMPPRRADGTGQFAFADVDRVRRVLGDAGWRDVAIEPLDVECALPLDELQTYVTRMGTVGLVLQQRAEPERSKIAAVVRAAFEPFVRGAEARYVAACWTITARAP